MNCDTCRYDLRHNGRLQLIEESGRSVHSGDLCTHPESNNREFWCAVHPGLPCPGWAPIGEQQAEAA